MPKRTTGRYERTTVGGEEVAAFIPNGLPPDDPPITLDAVLTERIRVAEQALVRLELAGEMVPSLDWFIYAFVRKEAVLSSQIEGTQATLVDLLTYEAQEGAVQAAPPNADVEEVCNYLDALTYTEKYMHAEVTLPPLVRAGLLHVQFETIHPYLDGNGRIGACSSRCCSSTGTS